MTRPRCDCEANPAIKCRFSRFRNPPIAWRVFLVAVVLAMPGFLAGGMVGLVLGQFLVCSLAGALIFALVGAAMEAWPIQPHANYQHRSVRSVAFPRQSSPGHFNRGGGMAID